LFSRNRINHPLNSILKFVLDTAYVKRIAELAFNPSSETQRSRPLFKTWHLNCFEYIALCLKKDGELVKKDR